MSEGTRRMTMRGGHAAPGHTYLHLVDSANRADVQLTGKRRHEHRPLCYMHVPGGVDRKLVRPTRHDLELRRESSG